MLNYGTNLIFYLTTFELGLRVEISLADMERADYVAQIKTLSDTLSQFKDMYSYLNPLLTENSLVLNLLKKKSPLWGGFPI